MPMARFPVHLTAALMWVWVVALPVITAAQTEVPKSSILTIDSERLFRQSVYGQRIMREFEAERERLLEDKVKIEGELEAEELDLTQKRATLEPNEFRKLAEAFDTKVQAARLAQDETSRRLTRDLEQDRAEFLRVSLPFLAEIVRAAGAVAVLERTSVFLSADSVDITTLAIARMNESIGDEITPNE